VARLAVESGADVRYVGTACPKRPSPSGPRVARSAGRRGQFRASLEQDLAAMDEFKPDLAIGTTPVVQKAKERAIPRSTSPT
jgi:chlorophyllide a reductase subunit Y